MFKSRTVALFFLAGLLLSVQVQIVRGTEKHVALSDVQRRALTLKRERAEMEQLEEKVEEITKQIAVYQGERASGGDIENALRKQVADMKKASGLTSLTGQGIVLIINDGERELYESEDPNNVLVHNVDVQNLVDDLRYAGAEAISVNDQRYVFGKTKIQCTGPTLRINSDVFAQPFIIKAIGNKHHLEAAVNAPGAFGQVLRQYGVFLEVYTSVNLEIPSYTGGISPLYMKEIESGEES